jgi:hypothetical protein
MSRTAPNNYAQRLPALSATRCRRSAAGCRMTVAALILLTPPIPLLAAQQPAAAGPTQAEYAAPRPSTASAPADPAPAANDGTPRWLDAVRAQRKALQEHIRAQHQARRRAIDPVGTARQEAREQEFYRRRQTLREMREQDRMLFLNLGPWATPLPPVPGSGLATPAPPPNSPESADNARPNDLPDWNNNWYFRGW